ncbi:MAG: translation elongation factor 4 [bacterium]|nr:translation elongation factor 4 [bacterium]
MEKNIRNFCIIAHIDHGKSTLADRFLELTGTVEKRKMHEQFLDMHPLEREKGITIKMQPVRMDYKNYMFNLIDTPGHVDFTYEVSRALEAVEGAILLVDATQGVQAQTIANLHLAQRAGLKIIPAVNKVDLASAEIEKTEEEIRNLLGDEDIVISKISGKLGTGVVELLERVVEEVPGPKKNMSIYRNIGTPEGPLRALVFDSIYDSYQGVIAYIRVFEGNTKNGEGLYFMRTDSRGEAKEIGIFSPQRKITGHLGEGEIGYVVTGIKEPDKVKVGDTITRYSDMSKYRNTETPEGLAPLPGYKEPEPMVFASVFPENQDDYAELRESLKKLKLNDAAVVFEPEESILSLGRGFRVGFLGMLHMEIVAERLKREYDLNLVFSNPSVAFKIMRGGVYEIIYSPARIPNSNLIETMEEPWVKLEIITPAQYLGGLTTLLSERYGRILETRDLAGDRLLLLAEAPLREVIVDFYDKLKSISQGFASMAYELLGYRGGDLVRMDVLVAGEKISSFTEVVPKEEAYNLARAKLEKLKGLLPRELFAIALQAEVEGKIIARETIPAMRKDVTGYLYGGDRTRKMKLWKKQQKGKKRLLASARVEIPAEVFLKMIRK